ncbi:RagB/SusD family nutrient uptake outer membrane protein [Maribacter hydrothermalis]|uniref:Starch-binding associating with outer membrane n=1 Tax=Maribacter hydrothermalis TaxID=1836467 RepID=A0A1B7YXF8_9FLAO|nr:RagB/SusD family nutrient uptake outer membrane protein [Maribacter hydrothermalis]APQ16745.1 hypothetical protein BTR34_05170 [Maribacter hydrothermalis]OBR35172.1 hypothetical protein A9200_11400 [Maribacter hydrothermalis]
MKSYINKSIILLVFIGIIACEKRLDEEVFSELAPSTLFTSEKGIKSVLNAAYAYAHRPGLQDSWSSYHLASMTTGEVWGQGGSIENLWISEIDFTWDGNHDHIRAQWTIYFNSIRDANIVLDNLDNEAFSEEFKQLTEAEVHFLRGWDYSELYNLFGPVPLYKTSTDDPLLLRASESEVQEFIEQELLTAISTLPVQAPALGRASKGAAMAVLCKYYLNTKQWENAANMAEDIIDLGVYELLPDYGQVFSIANEGNNELIWVLPKDGTSPTASQAIDALVFPPDYPRPYPNNTVFAARTYLYDDFVNSFDANDQRKNYIITEYVSTNTGEVVPGLGNDRSFPYKIEFDPGSVGATAGNDIPAIRYADILLSRAEALNEISGPTQPAIDLINEVRNRAGIDDLTLSGFTKESLRETLLQERAWELFFEGKRREDMIRQGVFISDAVSRGKSAQDYHRLFPIPQVELDANPGLIQNTGY